MWDSASVIRLHIVLLQDIEVERNAGVGSHAKFNFPFQNLVEKKNERKTETDKTSKIMQQMKVKKRVASSVQYKKKFCICLMGCSAE